MPRPCAGSKLRSEYEQAREVAIAMRPRHFSRRRECVCDLPRQSDDKMQTRSAYISREAIEQVMEFDPDQENILGILDEIPIATMTASEIAVEHIVGALRKPKGTE